MADKYILKDEAVNAVKSLISKMPANDNYAKGYDAAIGRALIAVRDVPTAADVQPVKHGEWDFRGYQLFKCTNCKEIFTQNQLEAMQNHIDQEEFTFPNFCPNCGARMDGDVE